MLDYKSIIIKRYALGLSYKELAEEFSASKSEYYGAAEPPVRCGESHLSGLTEPPIDSYSA